MKKPIFAFLVLVRALLKLFKLELSTACWSREFHLSMTLSAKKYFLRSKWHWCLANLMLWPLMWLLLSAIGSPIIVTIWNVVFANKSWKLGWIWMKLGRWGWGLKRLKPCKFLAKSHYGFRREHKIMGRNAPDSVHAPWFCSFRLWRFINHLLTYLLVFFSRERRSTSATFLGSISAKLSTNTCPGGVSRHTWFHVPEKFPFRGQISPKTVFLGYFRVPCLCSAYGSREMFCDIPQIYPSWVTFAEGCTVIQLSTSESPLPQCQQWRYLDGVTLAPSGERWDTNQ